MIRRQNTTEALQDGFTITELLIAVAVGAIASLLMVTAFVFLHGSVIVEQTKTSMTRESQVFLKRMTEDIRIGNEIRTSNLLSDPCGAGDVWVTSDPANILVITTPAIDSADELIIDPNTGYPYQHEAIYFSSNGNMYRRLIKNIAATTSEQESTCAQGTAGFLQDIELVGNVDNMLFEFYDSNNDVTSVPEEARSVQVTINLFKRLAGQDIKTTNTTRVTLRNEN